MAVVVLALGMGCVSPTGVRGEAAMEIVKVDEGRFIPEPGKPVFVLVMGQDARPGQAQSRGDALHVIGINPEAAPGHHPQHPPGHVDQHPRAGASTRSTPPTTTAGPCCRPGPCPRWSGVDISIVITTGFDGLADMIDELGGINVDVPFPMNDPKSGAIFPAGTVRMDGGAALAFARNRSVAGGDFTRTQDQGILILAGLSKLRDSVALGGQHPEVDGGAGPPHPLRRDRLRRPLPPGPAGADPRPRRGAQRHHAGDDGLSGQPVRGVRRRLGAGAVRRLPG